jgi:hypothetical protein
MRNKSFLVLAVTALIFTAGAGKNIAAKDNTKPAALNRARANDTSAFDAAEITQQLNELLLNQAEILRQLQEIRQELNIIKIRSTR